MKVKNVKNALLREEYFACTHESGLKIIYVPKNSPATCAMLCVNFGAFDVRYVKDGKRIPVINTALPRANQYFTAWHEIYHLLFDYVSLDHFIEADQTLEERKAEYFAAKMLLNDVERYYAELSEMDFLSRIFCCMSAYQAPYKAVLISLYEYAEKIGFKKLQDQIREVFDLQINDLADRFKSLGLDDSLVKPSYVINTGYLQGKIREQKKENPELTYHEDNEVFLENIKKELTLLTGKNSDKN